jgi:hypothetical protein
MTNQVPSSWLASVAQLVVGREYEENFWCHLDYPFQDCSIELEKMQLISTGYVFKLLILMVDEERKLMRVAGSF